MSTPPPTHPPPTHPPTLTTHTYTHNHTLVWFAKSTFRKPCFARRAPKAKGLRLTICVEEVAASGGYMMACTAVPGPPSQGFFEGWTLGRRPPLPVHLTPPPK